LALARAYARVLQRVGHARWFADTTKHVISELDRAFYRSTGGRLTSSGPALPTVLLTTVGRKSGRPYTVPIYYLRDGDDLVVASENFGLKTRSSWPQNLRANPVARVQIGRQGGWYRARAASEAEVRRHWPRFLAIWPAMQTYYEPSGERWMFVLEPTTETDHRIVAGA
jgi:deazaflavin-dependent oxidoreductase (nitroreductase family)